VTTAENQNETTTAERVSDDDVQAALLVVAKARPDQLATMLDTHVKSVRWGRTVNTGNYSSARLDVEADVPTVGDPESTLRLLQSWVDQHLPLHDSEIQHLLTRTSELRLEERRLLDQVDNARAHWKRIEAFMERVGLEIPSPTLEDLPF
jgi:hypothetical protein